MKTAYVLSGGGAKAAFQAAVIDTLHIHGVEPDHVVGVSAGALNGALVSMGRAGGLADVFTGFRSGNVYGGIWNSLGFLGRLIRGFQILVGAKTSIYDSRIKKLLDGYYDPSMTRVPLTVSCTDLSTSKAKYVTVRPGSDISPDYAKKMIAASASVPGLVEPIGGLADGGIRNMAPLSRAIDEGAERVIVISNDILEPESSPVRELNNILDVGGAVIDAFTDEVILDDIRSATRINEIVRQASAAGVSLESPSGEPYRSVEIHVIEPESDLGSATDFAESVQTERADMGRRVGREAARLLM